MSRKNVKPNAFHLFMLDWKKQEEKKGCTFPNGLKDVQTDSRCNESWKNLSAEMKSFYKDKANDRKLQLKIDKKSSVGESLKEVTAVQVKEAEFIDNMKQFISSFVQEANMNNSVPKLKFYTIHVNYFYTRILENNEIKFCPAEISVAEFSLKEGVTKKYNKIINSKIEMGYAYEASDYSKNTHQIPIEPDFGESNYEIIYKEINDFLEPGKINGKMPPLYTQFDAPDVKFPVDYVLNTFSNINKSFDKFILYSVEELFANLYNIKAEDNGKSQIDSVMASIKLKNDPYSYSRSLECEFHQMFGGGNYCSNSFVQRWIFVVCSIVCPLFNIDLKLKHHLPVESDTSEKWGLQDSFQQMYLKRINKRSKAASTSGTSERTIKHASERNFADNKDRRNMSLTKPITTIDHSLHNTQSASTLASQKPERPFTKPLSRYENSTNIDFNETDFPSIGRGFGGRRNQENKPKKTDYASRLK